MPRHGYKKGGINQRERVSLIAELLLEGAEKVMEKVKVNRLEKTKDRLSLSGINPLEDISERRAFINPR